MVEHLPSVPEYRGKGRARGGMGKQGRKGCTCHSWHHLGSLKHILQRPVEHRKGDVQAFLVLLQLGNFSDE